MFAGAGGFHGPRSEICSERIGGGNDHLGEAYIVIGEEDHLQVFADRRVVC